MENDVPFPHGERPKDPPKNIFHALNAIMDELGAITKDRTNTHQKYQFRGIDNVYNAVNPLFAKHGVISVPTVLEDRHEERESKSGGVNIYRVLKIRYDFYALDGSSVPATVIGEGMDSSDKASNKAMAVAHKYAILQVLAVPTEEPKDPEEDSHQVAANPDIYRATEDQKNFLRAAFAKIPALTNPDKEAISTAMRNRHMRELDRAIQDHLAKKKT